MIQEEDLPPSYRQAKGFHLIWGSYAELGTLMRSLRQTNLSITLVVELTPQQVEEPAEQLQAILPYVTLFSPNIDEATAVCGSMSPEKLADTLLTWGRTFGGYTNGSTGIIRQNAEWRAVALTRCAYRGD